MSAPRKGMASRLLATAAVLLLWLAPSQANCQNPADASIPSPFPSLVGQAQDATDSGVGLTNQGLPLVGPALPSRGPSLTLNLQAGATDPESLGSALEIVILMTILSLAPAIMLTMTCFTRVIIVLTFLKRAMSVQELPPRTVLTGFAFFLTLFLMRPVATDIYEQAYEPYVAKEIGWEEAGDRATQRLNRFMLAQTRDDDLRLIRELAEAELPRTVEETPFYVTVPAFILSEIKTAFTMGFVLFLPFVVIDIVISAILVSMGMFTLPPVVVSTPLKLLLFVLVGGWDLVVMSLAQSIQS